MINGSIDLDNIDNLIRACLFLGKDIEKKLPCQSKGTKEIELLLDYMLDFAGDEKILALYRKLCRYYFDINPQATGEYIQSYKEMYDSDEKLFNSGYFRNNPIRK